MLSNTSQLSKKLCYSLNSNDINLVYAFFQFYVFYKISYLPYPQLQTVTQFYLSYFLPVFIFWMSTLIKYFYEKELNWLKCLQLFRVIKRRLKIKHKFYTMSFRQSLSSNYSLLNCNGTYMSFCPKRQCFVSRSALRWDVRYWIACQRGRC